MGRWVTVLATILLASAITLVWVGTAAYLLRDLGGFIDPARATREELGVALLVVTVPPILVWLLASAAWRGGLSRAVRRIEAALAQRGEGLGSEVIQLREASDEAARQLSATAAAAEAQRGEMIQMAAPMAELASQLHGVLGEMESFEGRVGQTEGRLVTLRGHLVALGQAATPLLSLDEQVGRRAEGLLTTLETLAKRGEEAADRLQGQARALAEGAQALEDVGRRQLTDGKQIEGKALRRVDFLVEAKAVAEQLNAKAVDLHQLLKVEVPPEVMAAMKAGDVGAVARRLPRLKDNAGTRGLVLMYGHNQVFRAAADRFMEQFEVLLQDAREADPGNGLGALFLTSDLGRLYLVLARETGREVRIGQA